MDARLEALELKQRHLELHVEQLERLIRAFLDSTHEEEAARVRRRSTLDAMAVVTRAVTT